MTEVYLLEWTFTPADYFEEPVDFTCELCSIHVENGKAKARVSSARYPADHSARNQLHAELDARFMGAQVLSHNPYTLSKPNLSRLHPDGRKDAWVFPDAATLVISGSTVDFVHRGANGNVIRDSKRERINARIELSQLAARYVTDAAANAILRSYAAAVNDPRNELVHLYEIRDSLSQHFGGELAATSAVGISAVQWSRLGQLANNEPLTQGRHRGKQLGALRDATASELSEAREIARRMIEGYLRHLHTSAAQDVQDR
jgi:hypothetical protein